MLPPLSCHPRKIAINYPCHHGDDNHIEEENENNLQVVTLISITSLRQCHGQGRRYATAKEIINK